MLHLAKWMGLWAVAGVVSACGLEEPPAESSIGSPIQGGPGCSIFYCGDNAPTDGDGHLFDQLDLFGRFNYAGVRILGATIQPAPGEPRIPVELGVDRHWFYVTDEYGSFELRGGDLVAAQTIVHLEHESGETLEIKFAAYEEGAINFQAGAPEGIPIYQLMARKQGEPQDQFNHPVCNEQAPLTGDPYWSGAHSHYALVFRGDLYHPTGKYLLAEDPADGWFFLGCAGSGGAKMHLFRHTYAGAFHYGDPTNPPSFYTSPKRRTALMKAITADYCGNGSAFTIAGQKLAFTAAREFMPALPSPWDLQSYEGIWSHKGVLCLDVPRLGSWLLPQIEHECGRTIPSCGAAVDSWPAFGYAITANPW